MAEMIPQSDPFLVFDAINGEPVAVRQSSITRVFAGLEAAMIVTSDGAYLQVAGGIKDVIAKVTGVPQ